MKVNDAFEKHSRFPATKHIAQKNLFRCTKTFTFNDG